MLASSVLVSTSWWEGDVATPVAFERQGGVHLSARMFRRIVANGGRENPSFPLVPHQEENQENLPGPTQGLLE